MTSQGVSGSGSATDEPSKDGSVYEKKDEGYFSYYAQLSHQSQMLQDAIRTTAYQRAILGNATNLYKDRLVIDVGAGNGILSLFALQAGAKKVYAIEASNMAQLALENLVSASKGEPTPSALVDETLDADDEDWYLEAQGYRRPAPGSLTNSWIADRLVPVHAKVEDVTAARLEGNQQVDTIVSECLGVLLVHERMCESFIDARDRFLKPGGAMVPSAGTICFAPFEDKAVWEEAAVKARFWQTQSFHDVDLTPFFPHAWKESFSSPVIGCFNAQTLTSAACEHIVDFQTVAMAELRSFEVPLDWTMKSTGVIHGIGGWFDLHFNPPDQQASTSSGDTTDGDDSMGDMTSSTSNGTGTQGSSALSGAARPFEPATNGNSTDFGSSNTQASSDLLSMAAAAAASSSAAANLSSLLTGPTTLESTSYMSTSPFCAPTHWQQARLLLPEPLAVSS